MGRPRKFKLDFSMTEEEAVQQKKIANAKHDIYKAQLQELKLKEASKNLIDYKIINEISTTVFSKLKSILYAGCNTLPPQIVGKPAEETSQILYSWIDETLERFVTEFDTRVANIKVDEDDHRDNEEDLDET